MPYQRPGNSVYVVNSSGGIYLHEQPVCEQRSTGNYEVGIAVKQKAAHWTDGLAAQNQIANGEPYLILRRGIVSVADGGVGFADGDPVYIAQASSVTNGITGYALSKTSGAGKSKFGRVVELPGDGRGVPAGQVRVNLDERNSF